MNAVIIYYKNNFRKALIAPQNILSLKSYNNLQNTFFDPSSTNNNLHLLLRFMVRPAVLCVASAEFKLVKDIAIPAVLIPQG